MEDIGPRRNTYLARLSAVDAESAALQKSFGEFFAFTRVCIGWSRPAGPVMLASAQTFLCVRSNKPA
jgi:hypothetical protein